MERVVSREWRTKASYGGVKIRKAEDNDISLQVSLSSAWRFNTPRETSEKEACSRVYSDARTPPILVTV